MSIHLAFMFGPPIWRVMGNGRSIGMLLAAALLLLQMHGTRADEDDVRSYDHDDVREAVRRGEIVPLSDILRIVERDFNAPLLEVEFEREGDVWIYQVVLLSPNGRIIELYFDAKTTRLLRMKGASDD